MRWSNCAVNNNFNKILPCTNVELVSDRRLDYVFFSGIERSDGLDRLNRMQDDFLVILDRSLQLPDCDRLIGIV